METRSTTSHRFAGRLATFLTAASLLMTVGAASGAHTPDTPNLMATRYIDQVIEGGDLQAASLLLDDSAVLHTPEGVYLGAAGANQFSLESSAMFDDLDFQAQDITATDDMVVMEGTITGINVASYHGLPANCAAVAVPGLVVLTFEDGEITDQWVNYDPSTLTSQIDGFNQIEASRRPDCSTRLTAADEAVAVAAPEADLPPSCLERMQCELPY